MARRPRPTSCASGSGSFASPTSASLRRSCSQASMNASPSVGILPHLLPGRYKDYRVPLLRREKSQPNFFRSMPIHKDSGLLKMHVQQERTHKQGVYAVRKAPQIHVVGYSEYRHENEGTFSSRNDPSLWAWGDVRRSRQEKQFYHRVLNEKLSPRSQPAYVIGQAKPIVRSNKFEAIMKAWKDGEKKVDAIRNRRFGRGNQSKAEHTKIQNSSMFTLLQHRSHTKSTNPERQAPKLSTPRHFLW